MSEIFLMIGISAIVYSCWQSIKRQDFLQDQIKLTNERIDLLVEHGLELHDRLESQGSESEA